MYLPCESVARYLIPIFRSLVAKELVEKYDFTQDEAAEKLGTTQAAISQYIHSKRGYKGIEQFNKSLPEIQALASKTAKRMATEKMKADEVISSLCKLCELLREERKFPAK
ncbi:MAG: helix-turn-helix domain-containing protein [Candidatus Bathyarchaeota archaeon]|nr:helix-turn-helix domain-containing protein [Candidatus Bathyarchaeota archaeon]